MNKRFTYYGGDGVDPFNPLDLLPDLVLDMSVDVYRNAGITLSTDGDIAQRILNQGVGPTGFVEETSIQVAIFNTGGLGGQPFITPSHGNALAYCVDTGTIISGEFEAFVVVETLLGTGSAGIQTILCTESNTGRGYVRFDYGGASRILVSTGVGAAIAAFNFVDNTRYIFNFSRNSSNLVTLRVDNVIIGTATHTPAFTMSDFLGRADTDYRHYYSFLKSAELTPTERTDTFNFLNTRF